MIDVARLLDKESLGRLADCAVVGVSTPGSRLVRPVGSAASETAFRIASLTKPLTAVGTLLAVRRAGIGLDTPVRNVLPDLRDDWHADKRITIADMLSQTSGLASTVSADDVVRIGDSHSAAMETARLVVRAGSSRPPGSLWEYYNGNYFLAGAVMASLVGSSFEDALRDLVLRPWGLSAASFDAPANLAPGTERGRPVADVPYPRGRRPSGGLCANAEDLLTFGEHLLEDDALLSRMKVVRTRPGDPMRYGLGWAIGRSGQMYLNGRLPGYRAALMLVPDHGLVAVALASDSEALPDQARILSTLQQELTGDDLTEAIDAFAA